jgi:hypothetical protein
MNSDSEREQPLHILGCHVDAFYLAFKGEVSGNTRSMLNARLALATNVGTGVVVDIGESEFELFSRSRDGWWKLQNADGSVVIEEKAAKGWTIEFRPSALMLKRAGCRVALAFGRVIAANLLRKVEGERLRRGDLAVDVTGFGLRGIEPKSWVAARRATVQAIGTLGDYLRAGKRTGFVVGKTAIMFRAYDKIEELALAKNEGEKRDDTLAGWRKNGWNGEDDVTRCEFEVRGDALDEIDGGCLRDPEVFLDRLDALWGYCTRIWLRLCEVGMNERRDRWRTDVRWEALQRVSFGQDDGEIATRTRRRHPARARLAVSVSMNYAAVAGVIHRLPIEDAIAHVASWSEERASAYVHERVGVAMIAAGEAAAAEIIESRGPRGAAAFLIEKQNAACARASSAIEGLAQRRAIQEESHLGRSHRRPTHLPGTPNGHEETRRTKQGTIHRAH